MLRTSLSIRENYSDIAKVKYVRRFFFVIAMFAFSTVIFAPIDLLDRFFSCSLIALFFVFITYLVKNVATDSIGFVLFSFLSAFIGISYFLKYAMILHNPSLVWNVRGVLGSDSAIVEGISIEFYKIAPALCIFILGFYVAPKIADKIRLSSIQVATPKMVLIVASSVAILLVKAIGQYVFVVGSPTESAVGLPPLIAALYEFFVQDTSIVLLNVFFFFALLARHRRLVNILGFVLFINIALSLSMGVKYEMVAQTFALLYFLYEFQYAISKRKRIKLYFVVFLLLALMLALYPYVNPFRHAIKNNITTSEAIGLAVEQSKYDSVESSTGISLLFARVSGIGTYYAAVELGKNEALSASSIFTNETSLMMKAAVFGNFADEVKVGFGGAQFSNLYLVGGPILLYFGAFIYGFGVRFITALVYKFIIVYDSTRMAITPFISFFWISFLLAGGNLLLYQKKLFVLICFLILLEKIALQSNLGLVTSRRKSY